ncbi:MAG: DUF2807 domain-containing protein [Bacteroidales bacterium]|nr:DUF2807 domain-containing protein [Bacteroidales bacterium]MCD8393933.1 DUF2807 domain-containing protein [Bacteroidales bacterium]
MKRIILSLTLILSLALTAGARHPHHDQQPQGDRVVLKPAREFSTVTINGPLVVELKYHPDYHGYVVYYTDNQEAPRVKVTSEGPNLTIEGDSTLNAVTSRVTVLCDLPLTAITSDNATILCRRVPRTPDLTITTTGVGSFYGDKIGAGDITVFNKGAGTIDIRHIKAKAGAVLRRGSGAIIIDGKQVDDQMLWNKELVTEER